MSCQRRVVVRKRSHYNSFDAIQRKHDESMRLGAQYYVQTGPINILSDHMGDVRPIIADFIGTWLDMPFKSKMLSGDRLINCMTSNLLPCLGY